MQINVGTHEPKMSKLNGQQIGNGKAQAKAKQNWTEQNRKLIFAELNIYFGKGKRLNAVTPDTLFPFSPLS